jgi:hypothetical protein
LGVDGFAVDYNIRHTFDDSLALVVITAQVTRTLVEINRPVSTTEQILRVRTPPFGGGPEGVMRNLPSAKLNQAVWFNESAWAHKVNSTLGRSHE